MVHGDYSGHVREKTTVECARDPVNTVRICMRNKYIVSNEPLKYVKKGKHVCNSSE